MIVNFLFNVRNLGVTALFINTVPIIISSRHSEREMLAKVFKSKFKFQLWLVIKGGKFICSSILMYSFREFFRENI